MKESDSIAKMEGTQLGYREDISEKCLFLMNIYRAKVTGCVVLPKIFSQGQDSIQQEVGDKKVWQGSALLIVTTKQKDIALKPIAQNVVKQLHMYANGAEHAMTATRAQR